MQNEINTIINSVLSNDTTSRVNPKYLLNISKKLLQTEHPDELIYSFLEVGHFPQINAMFYQSELQKEWLNTLFSLINKSKYNTGILFQQRVKRYSDHTLFQTINGKNITKISYQEAWNRIKTIASSILKLTQKSDQPVIGLYTPNSLESALVDLACLSFNIKIVPIPANTSKEHLKYIIQHAGITHLFIGGTEQANLIGTIPNELSSISIILLPKTPVPNIDHILWKDFVQKYSDNEDADLTNRLQLTAIDDDATIMYTSGTTANPKGIIFTQINIITKRFARALALPDINSNDVFLCYLPLYHTFGRYLEMMGAIFWGATYTFAESPSLKSLLKNMQIAKPSIFISIPKRWLQLYELFTSDTSVNSSNKNEITLLIEETTGGRLRLGLSAAGYLDPDIFKFFHKNHIQLLSGYGMTEATGGITMTPQNDYVKDSVGTPLPGVELKINNDKELLLRGPYVISYYHGINKISAHVDGWLHTGDIFEEKTNHYFIIDRKKEIYKNSRGLTISPQKIENMFQDFDAVKSVFLVGDGKAYNTVLLYPDNEWVKNLENEKDFNLQEYYSSLLQSVNSFLASYERIVNFAIIDRNFSAKNGELTPKKTFKRKTILNNFIEYISPMYEKDYNSFLFNTNEVRIPKWLLRKSGIIAHDIKWDGEKLHIRNNVKSLELKFDESIIKIGDYIYNNSNNFLNLNTLVTSPELWLGNQQFVEFFNFSAISSKHFEQLSELAIELSKFKFQSIKIDKQTIDDLKHALREKVFDLKNIHNSAIILYNEYDYNLYTAINYLSKILVSDKYDLIEIAITLLTRLRFHPSFKTRVKSVEVLTPNINGELFIELLSEIYLTSDDPKILKDITLDIRVLKEDHFKCILNKLALFRHEISDVSPQQLSFIEALLNTITDYGIKHPTDYHWARSELIKWNLSSAPDNIISLTSIAIDNIISGFRKWLGPNRYIAIDQESGEEYSWKESIVFDPNVEDKYKETLFDAISKTQLLKEAIFLLSKHYIVQLDDIQLRGVWIMFLGQNHGKSVFRVTTQTRDHNNFNFVINLNEKQTDDSIRNEIKWLIITGSSSRGRKLVEDFGGYWPEYKLFTEEYVQGETLYQYLERNRSQIDSQENSDLWQLRWLHFILNGTMAYFSFYRRSNFKYYIANSSSHNLIIPERDYAVGTRLISISDRSLVDTLTSIIISLYEDFIIDSEKRYTGLKHVADWEVIFCAFLQTISVKKGIEQLEIFTKELGNKTHKDKAKKYNLTKDRIQKFISDINENGLLTKQVIFASLRYERWLNLNPQATIEARGSTIQQLYHDYNLGSLIDDYPETRIRFFLMTAFKDSNQSIKNELLTLQKGLRAKTISIKNLDEYINAIHKKIKLPHNDEYFITRLLFEHIDAEGIGKEFVWDSGSEGKLELISAITDNFGENHQIRQPNHPKEIAKFQTLLLNSNLSAIFNQKHEFLFIINSTNQLIGGVYWIKTDEKCAYLERIVINPKYQKRHLSSILLDELFNRLKNKQYKYITVGYFQAGLFYNKGFYIDKRFGGLVKDLTK